MQSKRKETTIPTYPRLMESKQYHYVILFTKEQCGTVINSADLDYPVGYTSNDWRMLNYKDFDGVIELSNNG